MGDSKSKLIIYTDGGANPNPSIYTGYGIHMYLADSDLKVKNIQGKYASTVSGYKSKTDIKLNNIETTGLKATLDCYGYNSVSTTNNQAELDGVLTAFSIVDIFLSDDLCKGHDVSEILLLCDSTYVLNAIHKILENRMNIQDVVSNVDYIESLIAATNGICGKFKLNIDKVPAHADNLGNNRADMLATMGRLLIQKDLRNNTNVKPRNKVKVSTAALWDAPKVDKDLFHFKQVFNFYPESTPRTYYGLNYKEDGDIGRHLNYITYNILKLDKEYAIVDDIIKMIRSSLQDMYVPYVVRLDNLLNSNILRDYLFFGDDYLTINQRGRLEILTPDKIPVALVMDPGVSTLIMDKLHAYEETIGKFVDGKLELIDITDRIYDVNDKGKTSIKKEIVNDKFNIDVKLDDCKVRVRTKFDLPPRNTLKRYEKKSPKVFLQMVDLGHMYEYHTFVTLEGKDIILSSNAYANKIIKRKKKKK